MFYKLKGILKEIIPPSRIILEQRDIFWEINVPFNWIEPLQKTYLEKKLEIWVVPLFRKNEYLELYGFLNKEEREFFIKLNTLSKIGPKLALNLLSFFSPEELKTVVEKKQIKELAKVPGIGEKRAERLVLELKGLLGKLYKKGKIISWEKENLLAEAKSSLVNLGFPSREVEEILFTVFEETDSLETLIKKALKKLAPPLIRENLCPEEPS